MYKLRFIDNTTFVTGKQSANKWIKLLEEDSQYWDWMYDRLIQASQHYTITINTSIITFSDR